MVASLRAFGTVVNGSPVTAPTVVLGDLMLLVMHAKMAPGSFDHNAVGWTSHDSVTVGSGVAGAGTGATTISVWSKMADSADVASPPVLTVTIVSGVPAGRVVSSQIVAIQGTSHFAWDVTLGTGASDAVADVNVSLSLPNPGTEVGDFLLVPIGIATADTLNTGITLTATGFAGTAVNGTTASSTIGNDLGTGSVYVGPVLTPPSSGNYTVAATTVLATTPTAGGVVVIVRETGDPGWGYIVLEDGSGNLEMENTTEDYVFDTLATDPWFIRRPVISNPALTRSFTR